MIVSGEGLFSGVNIGWRDTLTLEDRASARNMVTCFLWLSFRIVTGFLFNE